MSKFDIKIMQNMDDIELSVKSDCVYSFINKILLKSIIKEMTKKSSFCCDFPRNSNIFVLTKKL